MVHRTFRRRKQCRANRMAPLFFLLLAASAAIAQLPTASILGVVRDTTGAVVPNATLTARNVETGQSRTAITAGNGSYRFAALPVGNYEVRVEHPGFQSVVRSGLTLTVTQEAVVNFTMEVGAVTQEVEVREEAPLVNTTSGSLGGLVSEERVSDLPLNGRNYVDLTLLQTGIAQQRNMGITSSTVGLFFSSNGAPPRSNNYLLDGAIMQNLAAATASSASGTTLGVEGIREWRVITNSFSAEYGMTMGSQTLLVTKSGTNQFHGSAFEFLRNDNLDARNFFDRKTPAFSKRLPAFVRNNFGGSGGGPIRQDKMFFYLVYEGIRERLGQTIVSNTVPTADRVEGNLVPQIDPRIKPLLTVFPEPNLPNDQLTFPFSQSLTEDFGQGRWDYTISDQDSFFGRFTNDNNEKTTPRLFPQFTDSAQSQAQYTTVSETHIFSPVMLNTFRFSYSRTEAKFLSPSGIIGPQFSFVPGKEIGIINIGGVSSFGPNAPAPQNFKQNIFTWADDLFHTRGRHSLKFGALINRYQQFMEVSTFAKGSVTFPDISSFLQAKPSVFFAVTPGSVLDRTYHFTTFGFYVQDDVQVLNNLMVNVGLRYEFITTPVEVTGRGAALRDLRHDTATTLGKPFKNPSLSNVSPRVGFAWDVRGDGKTAVRGGAALLYDIATFGSSLAIGTTGTPPFSNRSTVGGPRARTFFDIPFTFPPGVEGRAVRTVDYRIAQPYLAQYNLTVERQLPWNMAATVAYAGSRGINIIQSTDGNPVVGEILPDGRKFFPAGASRVNPNFDTIELKTAGSSSWYNSLQVGVNKRFSNGLQFQSSYTFSRAIDTGQSQFTSENNSSNAFPSDPSNLSLDRGLSDFDVRNNWRFNAIYRLPDFSPAGGGLGKLLNGWWTSGILSIQSGLPFTPGLVNNRSRSGVNGGRGNIDRPNVVPGRDFGSIIQGGPDQFFDPAAFELQDAGFLGNAGRNILNGPGFATLDFTIAKDTPVPYLGEQGKLQFRAEFFNITNRVNFTTPGLGLFGGNNASLVFAGRADGEAPLPTAGRITSTASTSRQIQFALKVLF